MVAKKRQTTASRKTSAKSKKNRLSRTGQLTIGIVSVVAVLVGLVTIYSLRPTNALAMGCFDGYTSPVVPRDAEWNEDASIVITQTIGQPKYDSATRSCVWQETLTVKDQGGTTREVCDITLDGQRIACPDTRQTATIFSGTRTGDPNQPPYFPSTFSLSEVLEGGAAYKTITINY